MLIAIGCIIAKKRFYRNAAVLCYPVYMKYLGIDYGSKRVGLAMSDDMGMMAFPHSIVPNDMNLIKNISDICIKENISGVVVGESHDLSGKPNKIMGSIEEFVKNIETETDMPVYLQKEFMTTVEARGRGGKEMNNARKVTKEKQNPADASAAALILARFLEKKNLQK
jgi:putative holliday junction resolvase